MDLRDSKDESDSDYDSYPPSPWESPSDPRLFSDSEDEEDSGNDVMEVKVPPREIAVVDLTNE